MSEVAVLGSFILEFGECWKRSDQEELWTLLPTSPRLRVRELLLGVL